MKTRFGLLILILISSVWGNVRIASGAEPPVTDPSVPSPKAELANRWLMAELVTPWAEVWGDKYPGSEAVRMLLTVRKGDPLRAGQAWYDPSQRLHDWAWFGKRFDADRNGQVTKEELKAGPDIFARLDRDRDGAVTAEDFDWSDRSPWVRQNAISLRLFRAMDKNGNGKIDEAEMGQYFKKLAGDKEFLKPDDLSNALMGAMAQEYPRGKRKAKAVSDEVWLRSLFEGDLGSPFEGPSLGQFAPDFTLTTQDGKKQLTLSHYQNHKPVVLIFGSFT